MDTNSGKRAKIFEKSGEINKAIQLFDKARYNGYCAPALFESYAMAYHKLQDYDNEIQILDEGIEREQNQPATVSRLEARRDKAIQLLHKRLNEQKKMIEKQEKIHKQVSAMGTPKRPVGRVVLQYSEDMVFIKRYETIADAVREIGISSKSIRDASNGIQKRAGGSIWRYGDDNKE